MLDRFKKHIKNHFPHLVKTKFLLACSAGVDSVVLAYLCAELNLDYAIAHCNFRLRGAASDGDEQLVREIAENSKKTIFTTHFDTIGYINKNKVSLQVAARDLRYQWFSEIMEINQITTLLTAHHADDSLETFLINLSRGTGISGLTGIPEKTDVISRPLLCFSREDILRFAKTQNLIWREDASNDDLKYLRNKIRHDIVPMLKELHPTFLDNFLKTQRYLGQTANMLEEQMVELKEQLFEDKGGLIRISIKDINELNPIEPYLYSLFNDYGFTEWNDVKGLLTALSGKEVRSRTHRLLKDRDYLFLAKIMPSSSQKYDVLEGQTEVDTPVKLKIEKVKSLSKMNEDILYVDKKALKYPLIIRKWEKGDYFYPLGMTGKKKLSKFFKDEKLDVISKENQWLLCSKDAIVWIIGRRADERFKVTNNTNTILKISLNK